MKQILILLMTLCMSLTFTGCNESTNNTETQGEAINSSTDNNSEEVPTKDSFNSFEKTLSENGITFDKEEKIAEFVGAVEGYAYSTNNDYIEIYRYDTKSDSYSYAKKNNVITMGSWGDFPAIINGDLALYDDGDISQEIIDIFKNN